jgi:hypothetical protein
MFVISAPLGTLLDNQHGLFDVLNYNDISLPIVAVLDNGVPILKTASFVPLLFGVAGVVMTSIVLYLDETLPSYGSFVKRLQYENLSWPRIFYGISVFSFQYYLSGYLDNIHTDEFAINAILNIIALGSYFYYDNSTAGLLVSLATAIAGPLAEIFLVNVLHLYSYTNGNFFGVCSWIYSVYFCGGYAVSNLSRKIYLINLIKEDDGDKSDHNIQIR